MWIPTTARRPEGGPDAPARGSLALVLGVTALLLGVAATGAEDGDAEVPSPEASAGRVAVEVLVEGVEGELEHNVRSFLAIERFAGDEALPPAWIRRLHARAPEQIAEALQPFGFYRPTIDAELIEAPELWTARYRVDPGEPVLLAAVDLEVGGEGAGSAPFDQAMTDFPLAVGDVFLHQEYEAGKRLFTDTAARLGYFDGRFVTHVAEVDLESYRATIDLAYETGMRYAFGEVRFVHDDLVEEHLLEAALEFEAGDPFDLTLLQSLQVTLADTSFFSSIDVEPLRGQADGREVPIEITLLPAKRGRYNFGVGYGTDTGIRGQVRWNLRRLNRRGHSASVWVRASERESSFTVRYRVPLPWQGVERLEGLVGYGDRETDTYDTLQGRVGLGTSRLRGRWRQVTTLGVQTDDFTVGPDSGETIHLVPGVSFEFIEADDRIAPNLGFRLRFDLQGASDAVVSDYTFVRLVAGLKGVLAFGPESAIGQRHRLLGRFDAGWLATGDFRLLPPNVRFFTGGDQSLRGFGYHEVGGTDDNGEVIGGDSLAVGSLEYEYRATRNLGGALFFDAGMAGQTATEALSIGTGVGARMRTPIGPVRLDVAWAISEPGEPVRIHLSVGPDL
jgi:translocation and assembly module TamA